MSFARGSWLVGLLALCLCVPEAIASDAGVRRARQASIAAKRAFEEGRVAEAIATSRFALSLAERALPAHSLEIAEIAGDVAIYCELSGDREAEAAVVRDARDERPFALEVDAQHGRQKTT